MITLKNILVITIALIIGAVFWIFLFKSLPLGTFLSTIGAVFIRIHINASKKKLSNTIGDKINLWGSLVGSLLCPIGLIYTLFTEKIVFFFLAIVITIVIYSSSS